MPAALPTLAARQGGVLTRAQVLAAGRSEDWIRWQLSSGRWRAVHPGTYVTFTGPSGWRTRAWAAVLSAGPGAALAGGSAAYALGITRREPAVVDVAVPRSRRVLSRPDVRVHRRTDLAGCVVQADPPRTRVDETVIDLLPSRRSPDEVVGLLCDGLRQGADARTLRELLLARPRWRWRALALPALDECEEGVESPLEGRCRRDVITAHGLPAFELQVRQELDGWWVRADARCERFGARIELDGRLAHPSGRTDADTWRDNEVVIGTAEITLRYRWRHVAGRPCRTARQVERALRSRGWSGDARACEPGCTVGRGG